MREIRIDEVVKKDYRIAIPYVNKRVVPSFRDGLKPSQLRTIFCMMKIASNKMIKVGSIAGTTMAHYHPHGDASIIEVVVDLANKGILAKKGNYGNPHLYGPDSSHAAARYIESSMKPSMMELASTLLKYCPTEHSDIDGSEMPKYLYLPLPIAAITGSRGVGQASNTYIPGFTAKSLLAAIKNDDYHLLESTYGAQIIPEKSNLKKIWEEGHGKITYRFKLSKGEYAGAKGVFIEGDPRLFGKFLKATKKESDKQKALSELLRAQKEGLIKIYDVTSDKMFIAKQLNIRKIDVDWIWKHCMVLRDRTEIYMITVNKDGVTGRVSLRYWLNSVYNDYVKCYERYINDKINDKKRQIKILQYIKPVGELLLANKSDESIRKKLELDQWIIDEISKKSISNLRKDHSKEISNLKSEIEDLKKINIIESVDKLARKL